MHLSVPGKERDSERVRSQTKNRGNEVELESDAGVSFLLQNICDVIYESNNKYDLTSTTDCLSGKLGKLTFLVSEFLLNSQATNQVNMMEKIQEKATKVINEVIRRGKASHTPSTSKHEAERDKARSKSSRVTPYSYCSYCPKVYENSEYLLKHVLRRHSQELEQLHKQLLTVSKQSVKIPEQIESLNKFLEKEFNEIKTGLKSVKQGTVECSIENEDTPKQDSFVLERNIEALNELEMLKEKTEKHLAEHSSSELKELKLKCIETDENVQNLQEKFSELFNVIRDNILREKQQIENNLENQKLLKNQSEEISKLRSSMQIDLQEMKTAIRKHLQEQNSEWLYQFSTLQENNVSKFQQLEKLIEQTECKMKSSDYLQEIEQKFERQLQYFFQPKISQRKRKRSRHSVVVEERAANTTSIKSALKTHGTVLKSDRVKAQLKKDPNLLNDTKKEVQCLFEEKLKSFNVFPKKRGMSSEKFEKTMRMVNSEKEYLGAKYENFFSLRAHFDSLSKKLALQRQKKITFSDPLSTKHHFLHSTKENESQRKNELPVKNQDGSGYVISEYPKKPNVADAYKENGNQPELKLSVKNQNSSGFLVSDCIDKSDLSEKSDVPSQCSELDEWSKSDYMPEPQTIQEVHKKKLINMNFDFDPNGSLQSLSDWDGEAFDTK